MKTILLLFFTLLVSFSWANESLLDRPKLPLEVSLPLLQTITSDALVLGEGVIHAHVFIDPLCPRSQDFLSMVYESPKMQALYTYHFYLYGLARFDSVALIEAIYSHTHPLNALIDVMVQKKELPNVPITSDTKNKVARIAHIGARVDAYKRPYLILVKPRNP